MYKAIPKEQCQHDWFEYWHDCDSELLCGVDECSLCGYAKTDCGLKAEAIPKAIPEAKPYQKPYQKENK